MTTKPTDTPALAELLPCPFCGDSTQLEYCHGNGSIYCVECDTIGPGGRNEARARERWNTRTALREAPPTPSAEVRERIARIIEPNAFGGDFGLPDATVSKLAAFDKADAILAIIPPPSPTSPASVEAVREKGDDLHGPALDFVIEQIDGMLRQTGEKPT